jgi:hypothetical protein
MGTGDGYSALLTRRHRYTGKLSFYRRRVPGPIPLSRLIAIAVTRWRIEEDHQLARQPGRRTGYPLEVLVPLDRGLPARQYQPRAVTVAVQRRQDVGSDLEAGLIRITVPEPLRLLCDIVIPPPWRDRAHAAVVGLRRRRQHRARQAHRALERLCRDSTMITTNYSRRN